jgi:hypothetical protein
VSTPDDTLAWEARQRPRAAVAAVAAGLLTFGGGLYSGMTFSDVPHVNVVEELDRVVDPGAIAGLPSLRVPLYEFYDDNFAQLLIGSLITGAGALCIGAALTFLAYATAARRPEFPKAGLFIPVVGAVLMAVALVVVTLGTDATVDEVLDGPRTVDAIADAGGSSLLLAGQLIEVVSRFALGAGFVLVCLNAMRVGLLSRFMGVLGIIGGALFALPIFGGGPPVVQVFWLIAVGILLTGRWPSGMPPAWQTGKAEPWPSAVQARQRREAAAGRGEPHPEPAGVAAEAPHPSSKKKRKRRH